MEPLTVTCSTCQSRIRVRNPNLIGQIVNCPKCQSMIMVADPGKVEVTPRSHAAIDSMSVTKDDLPSVLSQEGGHGTADDQLLESNIPFSDEEYRLAPAEPSDAASHFGSAAPPPWSPEPAPLIPNDGWTTERTVKQRQMLMVIFGGVGSVVVSIVLLLVFLQWSSAKPKSTQEVATNELATPPNGLEDEMPTPQDPIFERPSELATTNDDTVPRMSDATSPLLESDNRDPATLRPDKSDTTASSLPDPTVPIDLTAGNDSSVVEGQSDGPLDMNNGANPGSTESTAANELGATGNDVPKLLVDFAPMLDWRIQPVLPDTEAIPTNAPLTADELGVSVAVDDPAATVQSIQQDLNSRKLAGIAIKNRPIWHVVNAWTNLTGIPTTVALDQLALSGIDRNTRVSLQSGAPQDIKSLADELAATMGLKATVRDERYLELHVAPEDLKASIPQSIRLPSTVDQALVQTWISEQLSTLFLDRMPILSISDGEVRIAPEQAGTKEWLDIVRIVDQWRVSLGEESQFGAVKNDMWTALWDPNPTVPMLDKTCETLTEQPQAVGILLSRVCSEANLACWIDWPNLGSIGIMPQTTRLYVTNARPLRNILKDFATETSAIVAVLDAQSVWITSPSGYRTNPKSFIAPIGARSIEDWTRELRIFTPLDGNNNQFLPIIKTPDEKFIVFRCCLPVAEL